MRSAFVLFLHSLERVRTITLVIGFLLALLQIVLLLVANSLDGQFAELGAILPPFVRTMLGPAFSSFLSFAGIVSLGYFDPPVLVASIGLSIAVATRVTYEIETGFIDSILARPIARHWLITRAIAVTLVTITIVVMMMMLGTWLGVNLLASPAAETPTPDLILRLAANLWLQCATWSAIALLLAAPARRRAIASGTAGILALIGFLLDYVARLWEPAERVAWLSPFAYFKPLELVSGDPLPADHIAVLATVTLIAWALSYALFLRRDISR